CFFYMIRCPPGSTPFPYTTLFRSLSAAKLFRKCSKYGRSRPCTKASGVGPRSEEHTSELQSHLNLGRRLLLEKTRRYWTTQNPVANQIVLGPQPASEVVR